MKEYIIKKGKHSSGFHIIRPTFKKAVMFNAMFDPSCLYEFPETDEDIMDINKLFGISTHWFHHTQSARIGWRCINGRTFQILTYTYNNKQRSTPVVLGEVEPDQLFTCSILDLGHFFLYSFKAQGDNAIFITKDRKDKLFFPIAYYLYPYFGGNEPAPHQMHIAIEMK
jgi:hypothetical protein